MLNLLQQIDNKLNNISSPKMYFSPPSVSNPYDSYIFPSNMPKGVKLNTMGVPPLTTSPDDLSTLRISDLDTDQ